MATYDVSIRVEGADELARRLRKYGSSILDLSESMNEVGDYLTRFYSGEVFASRGGVFGKPWARLSPSYAVEKAKRWPGRPPLVRTGLLMRSFNKKAERLSVEVYNDAKSRKGAPYPVFHQSGTSLMPARTLIHLDKQRADRIAKFISSDLEDKQRKTNV